MAKRRTVKAEAKEADKVRKKAGGAVKTDTAKESKSPKPKDILIKKHECKFGSTLTLRDFGITDPVCGLIIKTRFPTAVSK